ncbi:unnamed protein product [Durusdinium trenchii]|uniref:Ubiquitin-like domain-containing protein n=1 Tax=Durusdinium trenchii TaxID=1381693 RepID=A0ABP0K7C5_9DINO
MKVTVKFAEGKAVKCEVNENDDVDKLKELVRDEKGFEVERQRLIFKGNQLDGGRTWTDYGVKGEDGAVLIFSLEGGGVHPRRQLQIEEEEDLSGKKPGPLARSVLALHLHKDYLFAGTSSRCLCWNLADGDLRREFHLPSSDQPVAASSLVVVPQDSGLQLWTGLDVGSVAVFELETGWDLPGKNAGHDDCTWRVTIWDTDSFSCLQKYPAELMTCGADLSAMGAFDIPSISMSLLVLAGVDGSLCLRRITRREDRKLNCILLWYLGAETGCPATALDFHKASETILLGDAEALRHCADVSYASIQALHVSAAR